MVQQQARTAPIPKSRGFEHAADIGLDVPRIEAPGAVETNLAKESGTMPQPSVQDDTGRVVESCPFGHRSVPGGPHTPEPFKPDDHRRMFLSLVGSFSAPLGVASRVSGPGQARDREWTPFLF